MAYDGFLPQQTWETTFRALNHSAELLVVFLFFSFEGIYINQNPQTKINVSFPAPSRRPQVWKFGGEGVKKFHTFLEDSGTLYVLGLNSQYFHMKGDGHQPSSRALHTH